MQWWLVAVGLVVGVLVGWWIGTVKGKPVLGAVLGIFGLLGWIAMALIPRSTTPPPLGTPGPHETTTHGRPADLAEGTLPHHPDV